MKVPSDNPTVARKRLLGLNPSEVWFAAEGIVILVTVYLATSRF
jgi:hypothetical protein